MFSCERYQSTSGREDKRGGAVRLQKMVKFSPTVGVPDCTLIFVLISLDVKAVEQEMLMIELGLKLLTVYY